MNMHKNARLTPRGRERIVRQVESGQTLEAVAEAAGVCPRTARKWVDRYCREGLAGLQDRGAECAILCPGARKTFGSETARVHHPSRRCVGVAACGARAAIG